MSLPETLRLTEVLLGLGLLLQGLELLQTRRVYHIGGALEGPPVTWLILLRLALALGLVSGVAPIGTGANASLHLVLAVTSLHLVVRTHGPSCGGSDSMFFQVQLGLLVAALGFGAPVPSRLGLGWIAVQSVLSYALASVAKIRNPGWRTGEAVRNLLRSAGPYVLFEPARALADCPRLCCALGWGVLLFEFLFPLALVPGWDLTWLLLAAGLLFHLVNAALLGLNRFVWAWGATYPAIYFLSAVR